MRATVKQIATIPPDRICSLAGVVSQVSFVVVT
jgi:hypothetical protein